MIRDFEIMAEEGMTGGGKKRSGKKLLKSKSQQKSTSSPKKKSQKGGMESSGATYMDGRFFNESYKPDSCSDIDLGNDISGIESLKNGNFDINSLAQYGGKRGKSTCNNHKTSSMKKPIKKTKTLSKKKVVKKKSQKGGNEKSDYSMYIENRFFNEDISNPVLGESDVSGFDFIKNGNVNINMLASYGGSPLKKKKKPSSSTTTTTTKKPSSTTKKPSSSTKKQVLKKPKKLSGGNATYIDGSFYNPSNVMNNYGELPSDIMTAYGPLDSGNVGTGMLAPYTASNCEYANQNSDIQTGGKGKGKKSPVKKLLKSGGKVTKSPKAKKSPKATKTTKSKKLQGGRLDKIDTDMVDNAINPINTGIEKVNDFLSSVRGKFTGFSNKIGNMKFGNQRMAAGGSNRSKKESKKQIPKKSKKSSSKKQSTKKGKKHVGGGNGSDFALTLNSRGPVNAPDNYWGVDGKTWFQQFNKTGDYIPNSQLKYAAAPELSGYNQPVNQEVSGYDKMDMAFQ